MSEEQKSNIETTDTIDLSKVCTRCGRSALDSRLAVDEDALKEHLRCSLGGRPFKRTFKIADNRILVTFATLTNAMEQSIADFVDTKLDTKIDVAMLRLILSLESVTLIDPDSGEQNVKWETTIDDRKEFIKNPKKAIEDLADAIDPLLLQLIRRCHITFVILVATILETMVDENFYEGVGLH